MLVLAPYFIKPYLPNFEQPILLTSLAMSQQTINEHNTLKTNFEQAMPASPVNNSDTKQNLTICFYLQDGVEILDFAGPMEVFSYAGFKIFTVSDNKEKIKTQGILSITPDYDLSKTPLYDVLAVFGGNALKASKNAKLVQWVLKDTARTKYYFSVCTGAFILGEAGLLNNLKATTFHLSIDAFKERFPKIEVLSHVRFVDNGKVVTTAGISAGIDGALHMVSKLKGADEAKRVASLMEYDKWVPEQGLIVGGR